MGAKFLNLLLNIFIFILFGILFIAAFIVSKTGLPPDMDLSIIIPVAVIPLFLLVAVNAIKMKIGYRPLGKAGPKSTDKLFIAIQAIGGFSATILAIGYYKTGAIMLVISAIASWLVNREYVARIVKRYSWLY